MNYKHINRKEFLVELKKKLAWWGRQLSILEDDIERSARTPQQDYMDMINNLEREYRDLESRAEEIEKMNDKEYGFNKGIFEEEIEKFMQDLKDTRDYVKNV